MKTQALSLLSTACAPGRRLVQKTFFALTPFLVGATLSHAALLFNQNFDTLALGSLGGGGQSTWTAQPGVNVTAGGLGYNSGDIVINGGANHIQSNSISPSTATPLA
ncbi:MAG: hypothetical protein ABW223_12305, partial [Rariglobus sp.]